MLLEIFELEKTVISMEKKFMALQEIIDRQNAQIHEMNQIISTLKKSLSLKK